MKKTNKMPELEAILNEIVVGVKVYVSGQKKLTQYRKNHEEDYKKFENCIKMEYRKDMKNKTGRSNG